MKVKCTIFLMVLWTSSIFCQERQNNFLVGGDFNIGYFKYKDPNEVQTLTSNPNLINTRSKRFSYDLRINIGKMINDKSVAGIFGSHSSFHNYFYAELNGAPFIDQLSNEKAYAIGLFYRRNIFTGSKANFYLQPMLSYIDQSSDYSNEINSGYIRRNNTNGVDLSIDSGASFVLAKKWNFLIRLPIFTYTATSQTSSDELDSSVFEESKIKSYALNLDLNLRNIRIGMERLF